MDGKTPRRCTRISAIFKLVVPCNLFASVSAKHALNTSTDPVTCFKANCNMIVLLAVLDYWSNFWMIRVTIGWSELLLNDQSNYWMIRVTIGWSEFLLDDQRNYWIIRVTIGWSELLLDDQSAASQLLCLLQLTLGGGTRDHGGGEEEADSQDLASHCHRLSSANSKTSLQKYQRFYQ